MKKLCLFPLLFVLLLASSMLVACKTDVRVEESGQGGPLTYQLPTEWRVTKNGETLRYTVSYEGDSVTVTKEGKVIKNVILLRFTMDEAGNVVSREEQNGSRLEAVYDADGRLTATLLRDKHGALQQRTEYDENGRAVRVYTRETFNEVSLWEYTYGEDGELLSEALYHSYQGHTYEYRADGQTAAKNVFLMGFLLYLHEEYGEDGRLVRTYGYDEDGNISFRYEYDEFGNIAVRYDEEGNCFVSYREESDCDENGNQIARRRYDGDGVLLQEWHMTYDGSGVLTATVKRFYHLDGGELLGVIETQWDKEGNPTQETYYDADGNLTSRDVYTYEIIGGRPVETLALSYDGEGRLRERQECSYDENGNPTSELHFSADGSLSSRKDWRYDEGGNLLEAICRDGDGNVTDREKITYDEQSCLREETRYNRDGSISIRHVYDERNNLREEICYDGDDISTHNVYDYTYTYDDAGRLISSTSAMPAGRLDHAYESGSGLRRETIRDEDGNVIYTYETVYDNNGNPRIRQSILHGDEIRLEYEWSPEGGLRGCVQYGAGKEVLSRLEAGNYVACTLTEAQYRQLLKLLLAATEISNTGA